MVRAFPRRLFNIQAVDGVSRVACLPAVYELISHPSFKIKIQLVPSQSTVHLVLYSLRTPANVPEQRTTFLVEKY